MFVLLVIGWLSFRLIVLVCCFIVSCWLLVNSVGHSFALVVCCVVVWCFICGLVLVLVAWWWFGFVILLLALVMLFACLIVLYSNF